MTERELDADAREAYEHALEVVMRLRGAWAEHGMPLTAIGSRGQVRAHPLLAEIRRAELLADRLRQPLLPKHRGPSPSAVILPARPRPRPA
jgi:hypothetical protein